MFAFFAIVYVIAFRQFSEARNARRCDDYALAERLLAACWRLPFLADAIALEEQLQAVQQGSLRDGSRLSDDVSTRTQTGRLQLEALAKGKLATFDWEGALTLANSLIEHDASAPKPYWIRGLARVEMQQEMLALKDLEKSLAIDPEDFEIQRAYAGLLYQLGYAHKANECYRVLNEKRPDDLRVMLAWASCLQDLSQCEEAKKIVDTLLDWYPDSVDGLLERSRIALRQQDFDSAERSLRKAIEICPEHLNAQQILRTVIRNQNREEPSLDKSIEQIERRQAELKSRHSKLRKDASHLTELGWWMMKTGHDDEAVGWFYLALNEEPDFVSAHRGLMELFEKRGQSRRSQHHARLGEPSQQMTAKPHSIRRMQPVEISMLASGNMHSKSENEATDLSVRKLCSACHAYPPPETMPRSTWRKEVKQAYEFFRDSALGGEYPSLESVVSYYEKHSPETLAKIELEKNRSNPPVQFQKRGTGWMPNLPLQPGITHANLAGLLGSGNKELLLCDSRLDALLILKPYDRRPGGIVIPQVASPCHSTVCDLDRDGNQDMLVASIGSFFPTDDKLGKVMWLRAKTPGQFDAVDILEGLGRVTDIQVADFNGDSRLDLIVAVFGWRSGGEVLFLENQTTEWTHPRFISHSIDSRNGPIHVPIVDLNKDGRPDFVSVISQQHETVIAYLNQGTGEFRKETIFTPEHPSFGCSGIEVADLDGDQDLDLILTNGDVMDAPHVLKPYHGVQWLENEGAFPFKRHLLSPMHGVTRAVAADFDADGDQDIVAVSFLPEMHFPERVQLQLPSVVLFEQTSPTAFATHILESASCDHYSCVAGDWDNDGRIDLAVANYAWNGARPIPDAATLWYNSGSR